MARRRFTRNKRQYIWTAVQIQDNAVNTTAVSNNIVDRTDWAVQTSFNKGAVLERIRGSYSIIMNSVTTQGAEVWLAIYKQNDDETAADPATVGDYVDNDCLWQRVHSFRTVQSTAVGFGAMARVDGEIDVKARRRIDSNTLINFVFVATNVTGIARISGLIRGLVAVP